MNLRLLWVPGTTGGLACLSPSVWMLKHLVLAQE